MIKSARFEIERRHQLSYEEFAGEYLCPLKPVIVTDVLQNWPAMTRWTPDFFKREFGDVKFQLNEDPGQDAGYKANEQGVEYTMARFIDRVMASTDEHPAPYFRNRVLYDIFPTLKGDIQPLPECLLPN